MGADRHAKTPRSTTAEAIRTKTDLERETKERAARAAQERASQQKGGAAIDDLATKKEADAAAARHRDKAD
jgi:hypothetical protein